uniref:Uncharacterized protein n=1 Tax=Glossina pallidipes TaxID=7398 RepID=A0A1A9ZHP1_GLOPL
MAYILPTGTQKQQKKQTSRDSLQMAIDLLFNYNCFLLYPPPKHIEAIKSATLLATCRNPPCEHSDRSYLTCPYWQPFSSIPRNRNNPLEKVTFNRSFCGTENNGKPVTIIVSFEF